ncbi:MAG: LysR family transcriptional regulator [Henriciella sp.]|nr:LysR family transcriptional regulator [Henriciella sp.]
MNWQAIAFDWNQVRAFLATAEEGSLSAAARALGQTQPTLSRQVAALEETLGVTLFERAGRAMSLTTAGMDLLEHVRVMGEAATRVSLVASGQSQEVKGKVVITATAALATYHLPPILKKIREAAPQIQLDIITSNEVQDLTQREADISIRHARPTQPDLIAKLLGETVAHLYASKEYLHHLGPIETLKDVEQADFVGFDQNERLLGELAGFGLHLSLNNFRINTPSGTAMRQLVSEGMGIGILTKDIGLTDPGLHAILPDQFAIPVPVWLVTHRELHTSRRIRVVYDILAEELARSPFL